jgi:hypothetical protein
VKTTLSILPGSSATRALVGSMTKSTAGGALFRIRAVSLRVADLSAELAGRVGAFAHEVSLLFASPAPGTRAVARQMAYLVTCFARPGFFARLRALSGAMALLTAVVTCDLRAILGDVAKLLTRTASPAVLLRLWAVFGDMALLLAIPALHACRSFLLQDGACEGEMTLFSAVDAERGIRALDCNVTGLVASITLVRVGTLIRSMTP